MQLFEHVKEVLSRNESFCKDGKLFKNNVVEAALKLDADLLAILLNDETTKKHFFTTVEGVQVFDKVKFQQFVSNKQFLPDSYTTFKNKIGLTANGEYLTEANEVVLDFPYKDCVLEGGQTKEDQKRKEIFWNETLAEDEIDRLLEPKTFTNWLKFSEKGESTFDKLNLSKDNLLLKGNNLLILHSLIPQFWNKVQLIYIDPPNNTGGASFQYNDRFNHSSWLVFMHNRLSAAKQLLKDEGAIFIQIDYIELAHLRLLCDEVFGKENFVQIISIKTATPAGFKVVNPGPINVTEFVLMYTKNKKKYNFKKGYTKAPYQKDYSYYIKNPKEPYTKWEIGKLKDLAVEELGYDSEKDIAKAFDKKIAKVLIENKVEDLAFEMADSVFATYGPHKPAGRLKELIVESKAESDKIFYEKRDEGDPFILLNGRLLAFYGKKLQDVNGELCSTQLLTDFWSDLSWDSLSFEGGVKLKNGKKPEALLKRIIELNSEEGDIVLDYHLGSGTTCAVAHKLGRRYIGVEQLDYGENDSKNRLINVINGDTSGISKYVKWKGGGSFVYAELAENAASYISKIEALKSSKDAVALWNELKEKPFISYRVSPSEFDADIASFEQLELDDQKKLLISTIDKNHLYINYADIEDKTYNISDADKKLNLQFYNR